MYILKLDTTVVYDILHIILYINNYCVYIIHDIIYYPLDFVLNFGGFYQKSVNFVTIGSKNRTGFYWILYWIIGGFLLNIKSSRFYVKFTRFPYLGFQKRKI